MRSFIAVKISTGQRQKIADLIGDLRASEARVKWVRPENMHVTLKFLGEVDERNLPEIFDSFEKSLTNDQAFAFNIQNIGCFPNIRRPRVIWVGIERGKDELKVLAKKVDNLMSEFGFEREKRGFSPHLTIGRVKDTRGIESVTGRFDGIDFNTESCVIDEVVFFQSILRREGPTYIAHKVVQLQTKDKEG